MKDHINEKLWHGFLSYFLTSKPEILTKLRAPLGLGDGEITVNSKGYGFAIPDIEIEISEKRLVLIEVKVGPNNLDEHQKMLIARTFHRSLLSPRRDKSPLEKLTYTIIYPSDNAEKKISLPQNEVEREFVRKRKKTSDTVLTYKFTCPDEYTDQSGVKIKNYTIQLLEAKISPDQPKEKSKWNTDEAQKPFDIEVRIVPWKVLQDLIGEESEIRIAHFFPEN